VGTVAPVLLGSLLSLFFFFAVLAAELRDGDRRRVRELAVIVGILVLLTAYAAHAVIVASWAQTAGLAGFGLPGG
jgi:hypothetical protein